MNSRAIHFQEKPSLSSQSGTRSKVLHRIFDNKFIFTVLLPFALFFGQVFADSEPLASALFSACVGICFAAYFIAGGWRSFLGLMVLMWGAKLFIVALIVKVVIFESSTATLDSPVQTALVYLIGFAAVLAAVWAQRLLRIPKREGLMPQLDATRFLFLSYFFFGIGVVIPLLTAEKPAYVAFFNALASFRDFSIFTSMHWAAMRGSRRPFLHPLVLALCGCCLLIGMSGTSKQGFLNPLLIYFLGIMALTGFRYIYMYFLLIPVLAVFQLVLGPVADTLKSQVVGLSPLETAKVVWAANIDAFSNARLNEENKVMVRSNYELKNDYYFFANVGYLERFSLLKTGDKLVAATLQQGHTGWGFILWDLSCLPPRFLAPNKPMQSSNNQLARYAGMLAEDDFGTAVSFGLFPQLYNALGYFGVLLLGFPAIAVVFWWFRCFTGDHPHLTFYALVLVGAVQHSMAEDVLASFLFNFYTPLLLIIAMLPAIGLSKLFGRLSISPVRAAPSSPIQ